MTKDDKIIIIYLVSIAVGLLTGLIGSVFQIWIEKLAFFIKESMHFLHQYHIPLPFSASVITMVMVLIAWFLVKLVAPEAAGSGVQEIEGALLHERPIHWLRLLPVKFFGGLFAIAAKMVMGREGPTIQMGGNIGEMIGRICHVSREKCDTLIAAGAAAGLATAFNAPLAGVLFVIEEMRNEFNFSFLNFKMVLIACVVATIVLHVIIGPQPVIPMDVFSMPNLNSLWLFVIFGILVGFIGLLFNETLMRLLYLSDSFPSWVMFVFVLLVSAVVGLLSTVAPQTVGGGYEIIEQALTYYPEASVLLLLFITRFATTMICYMTGVPGGIFAPMLALGTILGLLFSQVTGWIFPDINIHPGMFAVAGMGGLFAAAVRAPITGIILVVEMTSNYQLILPLMITCLVSTTIVQLAANLPIYTQLLERTLKRQRIVT